MHHRQHVESCTRSATRLRRNVMIATGIWTLIGASAAAAAIFLAACQASTKVVGGSAEAGTESRSTTVILKAPQRPRPTRTILLIAPKEKPCSTPPDSASSPPSPPPPSASQAPSTPPDKPSSP